MKNNWVDGNVSFAVKSRNWFYYDIRNYFYKHSFLYFLLKIVVGLLLFFLPLAWTVYLSISNNSLVILPLYIALLLCSLFGICIILRMFQVFIHSNKYSFPSWDRLNTMQIIKMELVVLTIYFTWTAIADELRVVNKGDFVDEFNRETSDFKNTKLALFSSKLFFDVKEYSIWNVKLLLIWKPCVILAFFFWFDCLLFVEKHALVILLISGSLIMEYYNVKYLFLCTNDVFNSVPWLWIIFGFMFLGLRGGYRTITKTIEGNNINYLEIAFVMLFKLGVFFSLFSLLCSYIACLCGKYELQQNCFKYFIIAFPLFFVYDFGNYFMNLFFYSIEKEFFPVYKRIVFGVLLKRNYLFIKQNIQSYRVLREQMKAGVDNSEIIWQDNNNNHNQSYRGNNNKDRSHAEKNEEDEETQRLL